MRPTLDELAEFVAHSNRIEGEPDEPGHPLFDDHLKVAQWVVKRADDLVIVAPEAIHKRLMHSEPEKFPGQHRQVRVAVGGAEKMQPVDVPPALKRLDKRVNETMASLRIRTMVKPEEQALWDLHHEFERIHPFIDGNGRTGRLWLNALRLVAGYDWLTVKFEDRWDYYQAIQDYEARRDA